MPPDPASPSADPASSPPGEMIGRRMGRYAIDGVLGEGGMGLVYRARDTVLGRHVALKVLHDPKGSSEGGAQARRLVREARAAAALNHPNAVAIFDVGEEGGTAFIALELVEGHSLRHYIGASGALAVTMSLRLRWLVDVAAALAAAHRAGLVHRDVKPENVMIRSDGQVKVLDFGIARRFEADPDPSSSRAPVASAALAATLEGAITGTPQYMAPEQILNEPLDGRADQFSPDPATIASRRWTRSSTRSIPSPRRGRAPGATARACR
jgi:eukaryotic-like serine/threonine-protein kinase